MRLELADVVVFDYVDPFFVVTFSPVSLENDEKKSAHSSSMADTETERMLCVVVVLSPLLAFKSNDFDVGLQSELVCAKN